MNKVWCLLLLLPLSAHAIEPYQAQQVKEYKGSDIAPYQAEKVREYRSSAIEPYQAEKVKEYRGSGIEPYQADKAGEYRGKSVAPVKGGAIDRSRGEVPEANRRTQVPANVVQLPPAAAPAPAMPAPKPAAVSPKSVLGLWQTNIPGVVYTTPSGLTGYDILHVTSGTAAGLLSINANGTYSWNSYGGKKGKWVGTTDPEYPVEIIDTVENRRWRVGYSGSKQVLYIMSGSIWYEGRKAAVKKK